MQAYDVIVEPHPAAADLAFLEDQINLHNLTTTGIRDWHPLAIFVRDEHGQIIAGVSGGIWAGYLEIKYLWVLETLRGQGIGRRLLAEAEQQAIARGCRQILLDTYDFQAPAFYEKAGYTVFGTFEGVDGRYNRYYLAKRLTG